MKGPIPLKIFCPKVKSFSAKPPNLFNSLCFSRKEPIVSKKGIIKERGINSEPIYCLWGTICFTLSFPLTTNTIKKIIKRIKFFFYIR